jgi:hypothetical protein
MVTKGELEYGLNQLSALDLDIPVNITGTINVGTATVDTAAITNLSGYPTYADKATAEAALAVGALYVNTTTGALCVALA